MSTEQHNLAACAQEGTLSAITKTLDRMEKGQEKVVELLEKVANQEGKIVNLQGEASRAFKSVNELFARVRTVELAQAATVPEIKQHVHDTIDSLDARLVKLDQFFKLTTSRPAVMCYTAIVAMIALGTFCDVMYHFETIKAFLSFVRG